jgi:ribosome maturation factor RimP
LGKESQQATEMSSTIDPALVSELAAVAEQAGCELVHAEFKAGVLRLILDREGGINLADCETVSRQVSPLLDVSGFGGGRYTLEVSSPGLDREIYGPRDYQRFAGRLARVTFRNQETGHKRTVAGRLQEFAAELDSELRIVETESGETVRIPVADIMKARLEVEL